MLSDYTNIPDPASCLRPCGLDTLHLSVAPTVGFTPEFEKIRQRLPHLGHKENYVPFGLPFLLTHPHGYYGPGASRTLEFIGVGKMDSAAIVNTLIEIFDCDPLDLKVSRIDLCADWLGTTINDCRKSIKVQRKRNSAQYRNPNRNETYEAQRSEAGRCESLYFGSSKSKDYFRVYDKEAHLRKVMKVPLTVTLPPLWVRFERVFMKDGVPANLNTLGALLQNGADHDPFSPVEIHPAHDATSDMIYEWKGGTLNQRMNAAWTHYMIVTHGRNEAARQIRKENRKPQEAFDLLEKVLSDVATTQMPTPADLTARYQSSFAEQMFGSLSVEPIPDAAEQSATITISASEGNLPQSNHSATA